MAFNFPDSPTPGQSFFDPASGARYTYTNGTWTQVASSPVLKGTTGDVPPGNPDPGQLWWESDTGRMFIFYVDPGGAPGQWVQISGPMRTGGFLDWPAGASVDWWGPTEPAGTLFCAGQSLLRTDYAALFAAIGTTYGAADGTHFSLPDCRGRVTAGKDNMGGTNAARLSNTAQGWSGITSTTLGSGGANDRITLVVGHMPSHVHTPTYSGSGLYINAGGGGYRLTYAGADGTGQALSTTSVGGDAAHTLVQPTIICNKLICTGGV